MNTITATYNAADAKCLPGHGYQDADAMKWCTLDSPDAAPKTITVTPFVGVACDTIEELRAALGITVLPGDDIMWNVHGLPYGACEAPISDNDEIPF